MEERCCTMRVFLVREGDPASEAKFFRYLVEDRTSFQVGENKQTNRGPKNKTNRVSQPNLFLSFFLPFRPLLPTHRHHLNHYTGWELLIRRIHGVDWPSDPMKGPSCC